MTDQNISTPTDISPDVDVDTEIDAEEAEYQAEMAKIRGSSKGKDDLRNDEREDSDSEDEEAEYKKAMAKARGRKDDEGEEEADEDSLPAKDQKKDATKKEVWKLKVNGKEIDFDASDKEALKRAVQKGLGADERFEHSARIEKQAKSFIGKLRENFGEVLLNPSLGIPKEQILSWAEQILYKERVQPAMLTPEERERIAKDEELETYRQRDQREAAERKQREVEELKNQYRSDWEKKFADALETGGLPKTEWTVTRMAQYMRQALKNGHKHIQPADTIEYVKRDWIKAQQDLYSNMDGEKLLELLGNDMVDKIRKANLKRVNPGFQASNSTPRETRDTKPKKIYGSTEELMRDARRR